jgi:DNA-directed RNA polymerase specialized sigma24 family protein
MTSTASDPFDLVAEREERIERIKQVLRSLERCQLSVLIAHELRGESLGQIARTLGISIAEATNAYTDARQQLSEIPGA